MINGVEDEMSKLILAVNAGSGSVTMVAYAVRVGPGVDRELDPGGFDGDAEG